MYGGEKKKRKDRTKDFYNNRETRLSTETSLLRGGSSPLTDSTSPSLSLGQEFHAVHSRSGGYNHRWNGGGIDLNVF